MTEGVDYLDCPFCGEHDFDREGLKNHFLAGHCDEFNETPDIVRPVRRTESKPTG